MQRSRKSDGLKPTTDTPGEFKTYKSGFAVFGGSALLIVAIFYIISAIFPSHLLSKTQDDVSYSMQPQPINAHPVLKNSPLKTTSINWVDNTNEVWNKLFKEADRKYTKPDKQLFEDTIEAQGCGYALPATGSFYCLQNNTVYLDLSFFEEIKKRYPTASGLALAYIIGHAEGHHIQYLLGTAAKSQEAKSKMDPVAYQKYADKIEYQADFYAGVWAHYAYKKYIDHTDMEIAISAATQIAADRELNTDRVEPEHLSFASIGQHAYWFSKGFNSGDVKQADKVLAADDLQ